MKKIIAMICIGVVTFTSSGCSLIVDKENVTMIEKQENETVNNVKISDREYEKLLVAEGKPPKGVGYDDFDQRLRVREDNPVKESTYQGIADFSYETASKFLTDTDENMLYSPVSLYYALALATVGAEETTQKELLSILKIESEEELIQECGNLYRTLHEDNKMNKLWIGNSLWLDHNVNNQEINYQQDYMDIAMKDFYASLFSVDFSDPLTGAAMGRWIAEQTNDNLSYEQKPSTEQLMSIINTIYFFSEWDKAFDESNTKEDVFRTATGKKIPFDFMNKETHNGFSVGDGYTRADLHLKGNSKMVFILPEKKVDIEKLISKPDKMREIFTEGEEYFGEVIWQVPKFTNHDNLQLVEGLKALGVEEAFQMGADFSGITEDSPLSISNIIQATHISIDENGVEASAYTNILMVGSAMPTGKAEMILDRPFIYGIFVGDLPLFIGVCNNPQG